MIIYGGTQWRRGVFEPVGTVAGAGNSNTALHYQLTDDEPLPGTSYYRLKQTDFDGQHTQVRSFRCKDLRAVWN